MKRNLTKCKCFKSSYCYFYELWINWVIRIESESQSHSHSQTRKPSCRRQTRATRKHAKNCSNSTCLQSCRWQYWSIFIRLAVVASDCEISRNSLKIRTYRVQGYPRSSILGSIERALCNFLLVINSNFGRISYSFRHIDTFSYKIACFPHPTIVWRRLAEERLELST